MHRSSPARSSESLAWPSMLGGTGEKAALRRCRCTVAAARGRRRGRFLHRVLRHLRRVSLVQHAVPVMWPVAIFLMLVVAFYWGAIYLSVVAWINAIGHLLRGNFIRASIWLSIGC